MGYETVESTWVELRYGVPARGITLCKLDNPYLMKVFKQSALTKARQLTEESEGVDEIIHSQDLMELRRLEELLKRLIPDNEQ